MEFCISCGGIIPDDAVFCPNCGAAGTNYRLEHDDNAPTEAAAPAPEAVEEAAEAEAAEAGEHNDAESKAMRRYEKIMKSDEQPEKPAKAASGINKSAITGFIFSLLPLPLLLSPIIGLIVSCSAYKRARRGEYETNHESLAYAGKTISIIRIVMTVLLLAVAGAVIGVMAYLKENGMEINIKNLWS